MQLVKTANKEMKKNLEFARVFITIEETHASVTIKFKNMTSVEMNVDLEKFKSFKINYEFADDLHEAILYGYELPEEFLEYVLKYGDRFDTWGYKISYFDAAKNRRIKNPEKRILCGFSDIVVL